MRTRITPQAIYRALDEVNVRAARTLPDRENYHLHLSPALILLNPARHETPYDLANSLVHALIHHLRSDIREGDIDRRAEALLRSRALRERIFWKLTEVMLLYNGGGRKKGVVAGE